MQIRILSRAASALKITFTQALSRAKAVPISHRLKAFAYVSLVMLASAFSHHAAASEGDTLSLEMDKLSRDQDEGSRQADEADLIYEKMTPSQRKTYQICYAMKQQFTGQIPPSTYDFGSRGGDMEADDAYNKMMAQRTYVANDCSRFPEALDHSPAAHYRSPQGR